LCCIFKSIDGLSYLIQSAGLGALKPNTVILSWPHDWKNTSNWRSFIHSVRVVSEMRRAVIVAKEPEKFPDLTSRESGYLDIWWIVQDGGLMLLMTFLLKQHKVWKKCNLRLFTVAQITDNSIQIKNDLVQLMYNLRLTAEVHVIEMQDSDISAYTYERTLQAEQRKEMLSKMKLSKKQSSKEAQMIFDKGHRSRSGSINGISSVASSGADASGGGVVENRLATQSSVEESDGELGESAGSVQLMRLKSRPDEGNVRRMDTAVKINRLVQEKSSGSRLIMINLPKPPTIDEREFIYMEFIEALIEGLDQVFLVRGGGHEVVTIYS